MAHQILPRRQMPLRILSLMFQFQQSNFYCQIEKNPLIHCVLGDTLPFEIFGKEKQPKTKIIYSSHREQRVLHANVLPGRLWSIRIYHLMLV